MRPARRSFDLEVDGEFTGGCADSGFASGVGTPTICAVGPVGGKAHSPEEFMEVDTLVPRAQTLALAVAAADLSLHCHAPIYDRLLPHIAFPPLSNEFHDQRTVFADTSSMALSLPTASSSRRCASTAPTTAPPTDWHLGHLGMLANSGAALVIVEATARRAARPHHARLHRALFGRQRGRAGARHRALQAHRHREVRHPARACRPQGLLAAAVGGRRRAASRIRTRGRPSGRPPIAVRRRTGTRRAR